MAYAVLQILHLVFGLFFALLIVCATRGLSLHVWAMRDKLQEARVGAKPVKESALEEIPS